MSIYPIMLKVSGRQAVVVGGGPVGLRKVCVLLQAGAIVRLVAEQIDDEAGLEEAEVLREGYRPEHLAGAALVFACTDDRALNSRVSADARAAGALVNAVDQPEDCDFYVPAVVTDGPVVIAIGTGGAAPALAGGLKQRLADALPERVGDFAELLASFRDGLKARVPEVKARGRILKELAGPDGYQTFLDGGEPAMRKLLEKLERDIKLS